MLKARQRPRTLSMTTPGSHSRAYWLWPPALLLAEYVWISVHFDALPLLESAGVAREFGHLGILAPLLVVVATATYVLSGRQLRSELAVQFGTVGGGLRRPFGLAVNVVSFVGLHALTALLLARAASQSAIAWPWLVAWLALVASTTFALLFVLLPPRALWTLVSGSADALVLGAGAGVLAWTAGLVSERMWDGLSASTLQTVCWLMVPFSDQIVYVPEEALIGTEAFIVHVSPECSGFEGIGLIVVVMAIYLVSARDRLRFPRALSLLPGAIVAVWFGNALRIALLIGVGVKISPEVAVSGFHSKAGWLFFCGIALSLIALAQRWRWLARAEIASTELVETWNPSATYLAPLLALISTGLLTALFATNFDSLYALRIFAVAAALYLQRRHLPRPAWPASWQAPSIGVAVFVIWWVLLARPAPEQVAEFKQHVHELGQPMAAVWLTLRAFGSTVTVPIAEELAFRGFLLRRLISADFTEVDKTRLTPLALVGSSLAFGLMHPGAWIPASLAGLAYALAQRVRGRTGDAIVAHAVTNGLIAADVLLFDAYWLWA
jgi:exosortase E/protease (VPEID-CTERM system)